jgi:Secretion system C-terminal sorting domain
MKKVYLNAVTISYSKNIKEAISNTMPASGKGTLQLRGIKAVILAIFFILNGIVLQAQNCPTSGTTVLMNNENTYYPGTQANVAVGATSITLGAIGAGPNFGNTPISTGDIVLIIQMQGAQIFIPAAKNFATYGANANIGSGMINTNLIAGNMEFAVATNAVPIGGGVLNLAAGLTYNYQYAPFGATGQYTYQVIRVSTHFNIQLGATISTPQWNGSTGGVTVISAVNQIDFNGQTINASGSGFRGGGGRKLGGAAGTLKTDYYSLSTINAHGSKGEGVAGTPRYITVNNALVDNGAANEGYPSGSYARGGAGNAGGGASDSDPTSNDQNAGGGGGGNGGVGGLGGNGWFSFGLSGGHGGTPLQTYGAAPTYPITTYYGPGRLIMGGGGGAGTTNDGTGVPGNGAASGGATGGGLVIINSTTIIGTGTINANGNTGNSTVQIDGSGGGGAGGSILIYANSGQAGITATANGGNGGSNDPLAVGATQHGPGGGGGGGMIYSNAPLNAASSVTQGVAGISTGTSGTDNFGAGDGFVGVLTQTFPLTQLPPNMQICQSSVLPVTLLTFGASYISANNVKVAWTTTNEINAAYYEVERSSDGSNFIGVAQVDASNNLDQTHSYSVNDQLFNINGNEVYYRLRIVDNDGKYTYSNIIPVKLDQPENSFSVYPNPVDNYAILNLYSDKSDNGMLRLIDNSGRQILTKSITVTNGNNNIMVDQLGYLPKGIYIIQVMVSNNLYNQKIIKK